MRRAPSRLVPLIVVAAIAMPATCLAQMRLVSVNPIGLPGNHDSTNPRMSADGLRIVFESRATDLVPGDTSGKSHIYLWDARSSPPRLYRLSVDNANDPANGPSANPSISPDGSYVAFNSTATDLGAPPTGGWSNVYVRSIGGVPESWRTTWVSRTDKGQVPDSHCGRPSMSNVGTVAFECLAGNMVHGDTNSSTDVFLATVSGSEIIRVSTDSTGQQAEKGYSQYPSIDAAGRRVAFESYSNTLVFQDNTYPDVFVKNLDTGLLFQIPNRAGVPANSSSLRPSISADGRYVAFESQASDLVTPSTTRGRWHVFRHDLEAPVATANTLVSVGADGLESPSGGLRASINADGSRVAYEAADQVYVWASPPPSDYPAGAYVTQASRAPSGAHTNGSGIQAVLSPSTFDKGFVTWATSASNLDEDDKGVWWDVYVRPLARGVQSAAPRTIIATHPANGTPHQTTVEVTGPNLGQVAMYWAFSWFGVTEWIGGPLVAAAVGDLPTVTVGGVAATGVTMPDANTLAFAAPALPAGSSNLAVITYGDGEVVTLPVPLRAMALVPNSTTDTDQDALADWWELTYGLDPNSASDATKVQANGLTPVQSLAQQHHPTATSTRFLAEGATGGTFLTRIALMNPGVLPATALLRYLKRDGTLVTQSVAVGARSRATVDVETLGGMADAEFSTAVEADEVLVVDRTMRWTPTGRYGSHAERSVTAPATTWYLAEGATHSGFDLFYLLQNPTATAADVRVRYLLPGGAPLEKTYTVAPNSRFNVWVDTEQFPEGSGNALLANTDVSAVIEVQNGVPLIVERAMYLTRGGQFFAAGHESAGVTAPALRWSLAEGATGPYFDLFVLIANPNGQDAAVTATYLLQGGTTVTRAYTVRANSRFNIWVDYEDARLADAAVSTTIEVTNGVPVIVERAMWWPGDYATWAEAHNSAGSTETATRWGLAEGEVGGADATETYILVANTSPFAGQARVTLLFEDGTTDARTLDLAPSSRTNVPVREVFGAAVTNRRFGAIVESLPVGPNPAAQIAVERAMYSSPGGVVWAAGTNALATRLP